MNTFLQHPWFVNLVAKMLQNDKAVLSLFAENPFFDEPPVHIRANLYHYQFTSPEERKETGQWWVRTFVRPYLPPVSMKTPVFRQLLKHQGWID